jgi:cyclophilin family peptidyl-prolyl cis-trans isomerase
MTPETPVKAILLAASLVLVPSLCAQAPEPAAQPAPQAAPAAQPAPVPQAKPRVRLETSYGPIVVELEPALAPRTVENFLKYVQDGFYAGTIFHRVIPDFMIQGGGLLPDLTEKPSRPAIPNEAPETFQAGLRNVRGTLAMARTDDPDSATCQFYINTADNPSLDYKSSKEVGYCVFGRVVSGMEAVDKIGRVNTILRKGMQNVPEYAVRIKSAAVLPAP